MNCQHQFLRGPANKAKQSGSDTVRRTIRWSPLVLVALAGFITTGIGRPAIALDIRKKTDRDHIWVATWASSPRGPLPSDNANPGFTNQTVRLIAHTSAGGTKVRVKLSNAFGNDSLVIGAAHIALRNTKAETMPGTDRVLTFNGSGSVIIPPGAEMISDGVNLDVPALSDVAVSLYLPGPTGPATWHPAANQTNYVSTPGDFTGETQIPVDHTSTAWSYLTDVEVEAPKGTSAIVTMGDSITDGTGSTLDANHRWPDFLAARVTAQHMKLTVVEAGIAGNRVLHDISGPNGLARFDRDVLLQANVGYVIVLLGINDIGKSTSGDPPQPVSADEIIAGHQQMILRAHQVRLKILGCTLTPFEGASYFVPEGEVKRQAVNKFIRTSGAYDGVIDFDSVLRDPDYPSRMLRIYDKGDHIHPNDAGYQAMATAIDLTLFRHKR